MPRRSTCLGNWLVRAKSIEALFERFDDDMRGQGYLAMSGQQAANGQNRRFSTCPIVIGSP
jgi:hypothetical protein